MAIHVVLTRCRSFTILVCIVTSGYWILSSYLADLEEVAFEEGKLTVDNSELYLGDGLDHLHWFVQISDLHLSVFDDTGRTEDLLRLCSDHLDIIRPEVVMVTGDITDAKLANKEGSQQFRREWEQYDYALNRSGILRKTIWLDTRGNHDCFDVASLSSYNNFWKVYSVQGRAESRSYHYLHKTTDGDSFSFISVDACPDPGPKRPFNFFGVIYPASSNATQTIFFGHYPTSTINGPPDNALRELLGRGVAYLCGHLHTLGGLVPRLYALQRTGYLELELGDWRDQRLFRLMAVDHGMMSFADIDFRHWPVVLVTNPKHAQFLLPRHERLERIRTSTHIRILVFTHAPTVRTVRVSVDGGEVGEAEPVGAGPLYTLPWTAAMYGEGRHTLGVYVADSLGNEVTINQPFVIDYSLPEFDIWRRFILMSDMVSVLKTLFVLCYALAVAPLLLVKLLRIHLNITVRSQLLGHVVRLLQCWLRRYNLIAAAPKIYYSLLAYNTYVLFGPWFVGEILEGQVGGCFLYGIYIQGVWVTCTLTYIYGAFQMLIYSLALTLYLGQTLDHAASADRARKPCCSAVGVSTSAHTLHRHAARVWAPATVFSWLLAHGAFLLIIGLQVYLATLGFFRAYGAMALVLCPLRTWAVCLALWLRHLALQRRETGAVADHAHAGVDSGVRQ